MYRTGNEYNRMCKQAIDIMIDYDIRAYPLNMFDLCGKMGINLVAYSSYEDSNEQELLMKKSKDGLSNYDDPTLRPTIYYNDSQIPPRISHTLGHEIKHIIERDKDDSEDDLCDYFSKYLRCPLPYVIYLNISDIAEIISKFKISYEQATYIVKSAQNRVSSYGRAYFEYEIPLLKQLLGEKYDEKKIKII